MGERWTTSIDRYNVSQWAIDRPDESSATIDMETVTLSPKFQVVVPRSVREALGLRPGRQLLCFEHGGRIELVPIADVREMRGVLRGVDTRVPREGDRT